MSELDIESIWKEHQKSLKHARKVGKRRTSKLRVGSGGSTRSVPARLNREVKENEPIESPVPHFKDSKKKPKRVRILSGSSNHSTPDLEGHVPLRKSALTPPLSTKRRYSSVNSHPPFGKYRNSPPFTLTRLETPNTPPVRNGRKLRGSKFEVVPPVKPKKAFERKVDYDSWGEDSGNESDEHQTHYMPRPHPVAFYPPPAVVYGAPFPVFYPPPPKGAKGKKGRGVRKGERGYRDIYMDRKGASTKRSSKPRRSPLVKRRSVPPPRRSADSIDTPTDSSPSCVTDMSDDERPKYQYIFAGHNTYDPYGEQIDKTSAMYLVRHPKFASDFINWFIEDCLLEEFVPDALIEVYDELDRQSTYFGVPLYTPATSEPDLQAYYRPTLQVCEDFLGREIDRMIRELVKETVNSLADDILMDKIESIDPVMEWLDHLLSETILTVSYDLVKECVIELADDHIDKEYRNSILDDIIIDVVIENGPAIVNDSVFELLLEEFIEEEVIKPEAIEESTEVAQHVLKTFDDKISRRELKAVTVTAEDKLADSLCLEYLLSTIARQGQLWTESDYASQYLDSMVVNVLIEQFMGVLYNRDKTLNNKPLKKLHQKVVTDVALDVLLQKLSASLDEDVADVDEYERGVEDLKQFNIPL